MDNKMDYQIANEHNQYMRNQVVDSIREWEGIRKLAESFNLMIEISGNSFKVYYYGNGLSEKRYEQMFSLEDLARFVRTWALAKTWDLKK